MANTLADQDNPVTFYESRFYMFSNFSSFAVELDGIVWMTSEHAYQAAKFGNNTCVCKIQKARSAHDAKKIARAHEQSKRPDWDAIKLSVMERIVRAKLAQHPYVRQMLLETGHRRLVEDSPKDSFWGWGPDKQGDNHLGKIWMKLREELRH